MLFLAQYSSSEWKSERWQLVRIKLLLHVLCSYSYLFFKLRINRKPNIQRAVRSLGDKFHGRNSFASWDLRLVNSMNTFLQSFNLPLLKIITTSPFNSQNLNWQLVPKVVNNLPSVHHFMWTLQSGMGLHAVIPAIQRAEAGGLRGWSKPGKFNDTLSQSKMKSTKQPLSGLSFANMVSLCLSPCLTFPSSAHTILPPTSLYYSVLLAYICLKLISRVPPQESFPMSFWWHICCAHKELYHLLFVWIESISSFVTLFMYMLISPTMLRNLPMGRHYAYTSSPPAQHLHSAPEHG